MAARVFYRFFSHDIIRSLHSLAVIRLRKTAFVPQRQRFSSTRAASLTASLVTGTTLAAYHGVTALNSVRRIARSDPTRICIQSLIASAVTYACLRFANSPSLTWGVFASLFSLQVHFDRSLKSGMGQMAGAAIGTLVGLAALHSFPAAEAALPRLALTTLTTCLTSAFFPATNYSIFVAAALALQPPDSPLEALSRAVAIILGSGIGIMVSLTVVPQMARSRAFAVMAELLDDCRALLSAVPILSRDHDRAAVDALHEQFLRHLVDARAISGEARIRARFERGPTLNAALDAFHTLWHGLVLLDRVGQSHSGAFAAEDCAALGELVSAVRKNGSDYLHHLAAYLRDNAPLPASRDFLAPLHDAATHARSRCMERVSQTGHCPQRVQALSTLAFALAEVESNLKRISDLLEPQATA